MSSKKIIVLMVLVMLFMASIPFMVTGEPSKNNPRRQDAVWTEEDAKYNITYLANGNTSVNIVSPDRFEFNGTGIVVMWETIYSSYNDSVLQRHRVIKIVDGEVVKENINWIAMNASLNVTNNPAPQKYDDNEDHDYNWEVLGKTKRNRH